MKDLFYLLILLLFISSCSSSRVATSPTVKPNTAIKSTVKLKGNVPERKISTKNISGSKVTDFAETLKGVKYKYGSSSKKDGFDCSGFITYVFSNFNISVPRSSKDFTNAGQEVSTLQCRRGDLILFTGSDKNSGVVGHMGIITKNDKGILQFIHSASGNNAGVMISGMNSYFLPRFVKVIRVFSAP